MTTRYNKAIVAAAAGVIATIVAFVRSDEPESIPGSIELLTAAITTLLVYFVPNSK